MSDERVMTRRQVARMLRIDQLRYGDQQERDATYSRVTRGWWWRGFAVGFAAATAVIYALLWLTGNLA